VGAAAKAVDAGSEVGSAEEPKRASMSLFTDAWAGVGGGGVTVSDAGADAEAEESC